MNAVGKERRQAAIGSTRPRPCGNAKRGFDVQCIYFGEYRAALYSRNQSVDGGMLNGSADLRPGAFRPMWRAWVSHAPICRIALMVLENPSIAITRLRLYARTCRLISVLTLVSLRVRKCV